MKTFTCTVKDPMGLHARVAGKLVSAAVEFQCDVSITGASGNADAKRIMSVMRMGASQGEILTFTCEGSDEENAASALEALTKEIL